MKLTFNSKEKLIQTLRDAKQEHINWMHHVKLVAYGFEVSKDKVSLNPLESHLGQWIHYHTKALKAIDETLRSYCFDLKTTHMKLYALYFELYEELEGKSKGIFSALLHTNVEKNKSIQLHYKNIEEVSKGLIHHLLKVEKHLLEISVLDELERTI